MHTSSATTNISASKIPAIFSWSGGKDSAYALHKILGDGLYDVRYLLSTFNGNFKRLSMHGVCEELIEAQAASIGLPLLKVYVYESNNEEFETQMGTTLSAIVNEGIHHIIFGDIFLEDLRRYREEKMQVVNLQCVFPLWKRDTTTLVYEFINNGFKTIVCCANDACLDEAWVGRIIDNEFVQNLPAAIDPCGENGEFHSFCFDGPNFKQAIQFTLGEKVYKPLEITATGNSTQTQGFWYIDLLPAVKEPRQIKACPSCGQSFDCKANDIADCQCASIQLNDGERQKLAVRYEGCLCKNCLALAHP